LGGGGVDPTVTRFRKNKSQEGPLKRGQGGRRRVPDRGSAGKRADHQSISYSRGRACSAVAKKKKEERKKKGKKKKKKKKREEKEKKKKKEKKRKGASWPRRKPRGQYLLIEGGVVLIVGCWQMGKGGTSSDSLKEKERKGGKVLKEGKASSPKVCGKGRKERSASYLGEKICAGKLFQKGPRYALGRKRPPPSARAEKCRLSLQGREPVQTEFGERGEKGGKPKKGIKLLLIYRGRRPPRKRRGGSRQRTRKKKSEHPLGGTMTDSTSRGRSTTGFFQKRGGGGTGVSPSF